MKGFKQFMVELEAANFEWFSFDVENYSIHILFLPSNGGPLLEGKSKSVSLGGQYSAQIHKAHSPVGQEHIHVYAKNNQLFAMNVDGSAHDRSHGTKIPNKVAQAIGQKFPKIKLPSNNLIENASNEIMSLFSEQLLLG